MKWTLECPDSGTTYSADCENAITWMDALGEAVGLLQAAGFILPEGLLEASRNGDWSELEEDANND